MSKKKLTFLANRKLWQQVLKCLDEYSQNARMYSMVDVRFLIFFYLIIRVFFPFFVIGKMYPFTWVIEFFAYFESFMTSPQFDLLLWEMSKNYVSRNPQYCLQSAPICQDHFQNRARICWNVGSLWDLILYT